MRHFLISSAVIGLTACTNNMSSGQILTAETSGLEGLYFGGVIPDDGVSVQVTVSTVDMANDAVLISQPNGAMLRIDGQQVGGSLDAFYIQPANNVGGQKLAHGLSLSPSQGDNWSGVANPLKREFNIFMNIGAENDGKRIAAFVNPERNITGPSKIYDIIDNDGSQFALVSRNSDDPFSMVEYDAATGSAVMDFGPMSDFRMNRLPSGSQKRQQFFGNPALGTLSKPDHLGMWPVDTPEAVGFDSQALLGLVNDLRAQSGEDANASLVHSLLIMKDGKLVVEEYFRGADRDTPHDIRSAGKTFASIIVGALINEGVSIDETTALNTVIDVPHERAGEPITLGDLLTHTSGFDCYDGDNSTPGNENQMWQQTDTENLWEYIAGLDTVAVPGSRYAYCSGGMNLVGAMVSGVSGESVLGLLESRLFTPLGFKSAYWNVMPNGEGYFGGGAYLRSRDLAKIGQLYLDGGRWLGEDIIDVDWVNRSTSKQVAITPETTGLEEANFNQFYFGGEDGYGWHIHPIVAGDRVYDSYESSGNGGQITVVVPQLDLVVTLTGGNYGQGYIWGKWRQRLVGEQIIPAIIND